MSGKCKYCGCKLKDESNIRCDDCDKVFQDGADFGRRVEREDIGGAVRKLLQCAKDK